MSLFPCLPVLCLPSCVVFSILKCCVSANRQRVVSLNAHVYGFGDHVEKRVLRVKAGYRLLNARRTQAGRQVGTQACMHARRQTERQTNKLHLLHSLLSYDANFIDGIAVSTLASSTAWKSSLRADKAVRSTPTRRSGARRLPRSCSSTRSDQFINISGQQFNWIFSSSSGGITRASCQMSRELNSFGGYVPIGYFVTVSARRYRHDGLRRQRRRRQRLRRLGFV